MAIGPVPVSPRPAAELITAAIGDVRRVERQYSRARIVAPHACVAVATLVGRRALRLRFARSFCSSPGGVTQRGDRRGHRPLQATLREAILAYVASHNDRNKPFRWTKTADEILDKMRRFGRPTQKVHG